MLEIDHRHGRFGGDKPGADPGVSGEVRFGVSPVNAGTRYTPGQNGRCYDTSIPP
jgi:hypothetical protein